MTEGKSSIALLVRSGIAVEWNESLLGSEENFELKAAANSWMVKIQHQVSSMRQTADRRREI